MSGHSTYQPQSPFMKWMERRLPIASLIYSSFVAYPTPRNLNYWWTFGGILSFMLGVQIITGIVLAMHYTPQVDDGLQFRRIDHARRELRLAAALHPCQRRLVLLRRRLHPHRARHVLRLLQGAARGAVDPRRHPVPADGGDRLHGLRAAVGPDELLGGDRDHQPVLGDPRRRRCRSSPGCGAASRSAIRRSTASIRCTTCCRSSSPASSCCTSGRCTWSDRTTRPASSRRPRRTPSRSRPTPPSRTPSSSPVLHLLCLVRLLHSELSRPFRQLHPGQSAARRRRISCRNGTTCRSTRSCARSRTSSSA